MSEPRFSCTFDGRCVPDPSGSFASEEECLLNCRASEAKVVDEIIYQYNPELAVNLAPKDRVRILKLLTGSTIPESDSARALLSLSEFDLDKMCSEPLLYPYLSSVFPREDGSIEQYIEALQQLPCLEALLELDRLGEFGHYLRDSVAMNVHYDEEGNYIGLEFENGEAIEMPEDRSYRLHDVLDRALEAIDRRMLRYLEDMGHTGLIRCLMESSSRCIQNNPDIADYLTDIDRPIYTEMVQYLYDCYPKDGLSHSSSWAIPALTEAMLRKHPSLRGQVMRLCQERVEHCQAGRLKLDVGIDIEYRALKALARLGMTQTGNWCFIHREILNSVRGENYIELCLPGLPNPIERFEAIASKHLIWSSPHGVEFPFIKRVIREAFEFRPDYIPPFEVFDDYVGYGQESLLRYISDKTLITYIEAGGYKRYYNRYIQSLPLARRLHIKRAIGAVRPPSIE